MSAIGACGCYSNCSSLSSGACASSGCGTSCGGSANTTSSTSSSSTSSGDALRDWLDLFGDTSESRVVVASAAELASVQSLLESASELTEDASVTENVPPLSALDTTSEVDETEESAAMMSAMSMFAPMSLGTPGTVETVTDARNNVAAKLRDLLGSNIFQPAGAKFTITYNYQDDTITVGGNISTSAKTTLQNAINSGTAEVATLMQELRDSLGIDTPAGLTKRNFTLAMTSLADIVPSDDVSYNINVKITPNTANVPAGQTPPTVAYNIQVGGTLPAFNAANYPTLATSTDGKTAEVVKESAFSILADNSGLKHSWTLTKFLLTDDGKVRGTMTVTGATNYAFGAIGGGTPDPDPTEPGDEEEDTDIEDPGAGTPTIDSFIQTLMTKTGAGQGDVLQWLLDTIPWYDASITTGVQTGLSTTFKTAFQEWFSGTASSGTAADVDSFLFSNGLTNIVAPLT